MTKKVTLLVMDNEIKEAEIGCNIDEEEEENDQEDKTDDSYNAMELVGNTSDGGQMTTVIEAGDATKSNLDLIESPIFKPI